MRQQGIPRPMFAMLPVRLLALVAALLLFGGAALLWFGSSDGRADASTAPLPRTAEPDQLAEPDTLLAPPEPRAVKSREEQRFARADRDDDGRITQAEYLHARRRNFDRLDANGDGRLSFEEYAASGIAKFRKADADGNGQLQPAEFATTAPKPKNRQMASVEACRCPPARLAGLSDEAGQD